MAGAVCELADRGPSSGPGLAEVRTEIATRWTAAEWSQVREHAEKLGTSRSD